MIKLWINYILEDFNKLSLSFINFDVCFLECHMLYYRCQEQKVLIKQLTGEAFKTYGSFANMLEPKGPKLGKDSVEFFRDMGILSLGHSFGDFARKDICKRYLSLSYSQ